jgi:transcriptional regulator with XRE-family HTH domain
MRQNTPGFIGEKLTEARIARGFSVSDLAFLLGVNKQSVYKYETSGSSPRPTVMEKICEVLDFPPHYFTKDKDSQLQLDSPIFYRSLASTTKLPRQSAEVKLKWLKKIYRIYSIISSIFQRVNLPKFNYSNLSIHLTEILI